MDRIILPLYSYLKNKKYVYKQSGLNQWNAGGRSRDFDEVYIPIPKDVRYDFRGFFPGRERVFLLRTNNGKSMYAKVCQDNGKALMSNPNVILGQWILRDVLNIPRGKVVDYEDLSRSGFDSVVITKYSINDYYIEPASIGSYEEQFTDIY